MNLTLLATLLVCAALAWWLSGRDPAVTGENKAADFRRRTWRCAVTLLLVWAAGAAMLYGGAKGGFVLVTIVLPLAIIWAGCLSDLFAHGFHQLIDSADNRPFDPQHSARELDRLAGLVRSGQNEQAIELCIDLLKSGEVSALAMDALLFQIYSQLFAESRQVASPSLAEAHLLRREGRSLEAKSRLEELLRHEPHNLAAVLMLLRIYSCDLARREQAEAFLRTLERRPGVPPGFIGYARSSMREWMNANPSKEKSPEGIESLLVDKTYSRPSKP